MSQFGLWNFQNGTQGLKAGSYFVGDVTRP